MSRPRFGLETLGLFSLVAALLATGVGVAQAEGNWKLNGANISPTLLPLVQTKEVEGGLTLASKVSSIKVEMSCTGATLENTKLQTGGVVSSEAKVKFSGCLVKLNEIKQAACEPRSGTEKGVIITNELKAFLTSSGSTWIVKVEPKTGEALATILTSEECLAGEKIPVIGQFTLKNLELEKEGPTHLLAEGPSTELWLVSKTEEHKATVGGSAVFELAGEHKSQQWSAAEMGGIGNWRVSGSNVSAGLLPAVQTEIEKLEATKEPDMALLSKVTGNSFTISCTTAALLETKLQSEGRLEGKARFTGCVIILNGKVSTACEPHTGAEKGVLVTNKVKGNLTLHIGERIIRLQPAESESFITWELSEACAFAFKVPILGTITLKDGQNEMTVEKVVHLVLEGPLTELWMISKTAEHKMTIDGSATVFLTNAHAGLQWSGVPG